MYDTYVTIIGTVMTKPEERVTANTNTRVATFRVASHPRRFDQKSGKWVDSAGLRIKVHCWRKLAEHVAASVQVGDPVIIYGRETTRDWKTPEGEARTNFEVEAFAIGHDLTRGVATFTRIKAEPAGLVIDDDDAAARVNGELTYSLSEFPPSDEDYRLSMPADEDDALAVLRAAGMEAAGMEAASVEAAGAGLAGPGAVPAGGDDPDEEETGAADGSGGPDGRGRRRGRQPVPA